MFSNFCHLLKQALVDDANGDVIVTIPHIKFENGRPVFVDGKVERKNPKTQAKDKITGQIIEVYTDTFFNTKTDEEYYKGLDGKFYKSADLDFNIFEKAVIEGWVARDRLNNSLFLHDEEPYRAFSGYQTDGKEDEWKSETCPPYPIDSKFFPSLKWSDNPIKVRITLEQISK